MAKMVMPPAGPIDHVDHIDGMEECRIYIICYGTGNPKSDIIISDKIRISVMIC